MPQKLAASRSLQHWADLRRWPPCPGMLQLPGMDPHRRACALIGHFAEPSIAESALAAVAALARRGVTAFVPEDEPGEFGSLAQAVPRAELATRAQYMIAVGGDGT